MTDFDQEVIELHNIARKIEQSVGVGKLSIDLRKCADRLSTLNKPITQLDTAKGDQ